MYNFRRFGKCARSASADDGAYGGERELGALVLEARDIDKAFAGRAVVKDVSLVVQSGEGVALLGPNGAGKTTLLLLLAGVLRPDHGVVRVAGSAAVTRAARRALGLVPQEPGLYEELSGAENVTLFGRLAGLSGRPLRAGVERALAVADLSELRDLRASAYSGGMRRRLSMACALVHGPSLLLLDEPFVGIDDESRARLMTALLAQKRAGLALVVSTHRFDEVDALCDRTLRLARSPSALVSARGART